MILMEQSLLVPCDESPISPETLKKQELFRYLFLPVISLQPAEF